MPRNYESIKGDAIIKRRSSDQNEWDLGDLFVEAEDLAIFYLKRLQTTDLTLGEEEEQFSKGSREILNCLADDSGIARKDVQIRAKISRRIDPDGPLGWIRKSTVTYPVMQELYAFENDDDLNEMAKRTISQDMTIREVRTEMEDYCDKKAVDAGLYFCTTCDD